MLIVSLISAVLLELVFFNASRIFLSSDYTKQEITLPENDILKHPAILIDKSTSSITINDLDLMLNNVSFKTQGPNIFLKGSIYFTGDNFKFAPQRASTIEFNPGSDEYNLVFTKVRGRGQVNSITISFEGLDQTGAAFFLSDLTLNQEPTIHFLGLRVFLSFLLISSIWLCLKYRLYAKEFNWSNKLHRLSFICTVVLLIIGSLSISRMFFTDGANPITYSYYAGSGSFPVTGGAHQYFSHMPQTQQEVVQSDMFVRLMDAFSKGQTYIDFLVDPRLLQLDDPWDYTERMHKRIFGIYDVVLHNGHYYMYTGLSPLILYYPLYLIFGQPPLSDLVVSICAVLVILSLAWLYQTALKTYAVKPSVLFVNLGLITLCICAGTFYYLINPNHGIITYQLSITFNCLYLSLFMLCLKEQSALKRRILLTLAGVCVVLIVESRPMDVLISFILTLVLARTYLKEHLVKGIRSLSADLVCIGVPIILGAAGIMWYNYDRFQSIFEFGHFLQLTFNRNGATLPFDLQNISSMLYHTYLEPAGIIKNFPFIEQRLLNHTGYEDYGTFLYALIDGFGILQFSIILCFLLLIFKKHFTAQGSQAVLLYYSALAMIPLSLILSYTNFLLVGFAFRYTIEQVYILILFSMLLAFTCIKWGESISAKICCFIILGALCKSTFLGVFMTLAMDMTYKVNPDFYLYLRDVFTPFAF